MSLECNCGHISCVCDIIKNHDESCKFRKAACCRVPIECDEHNRDVCPICDKCECRVRSNKAIAIEARFVWPGSIFIKFEDGFEGQWTFFELGLDMDYLKDYIEPNSMKVIKGDVAFEDIYGESVILDASQLRCSVDAVYNAEIEAKLNELAKEGGW